MGLPDIGYGGQLSRINRWLVRIALHGAHAVTVGSTYLLDLVQPYVASDRLLLMPLRFYTGLFHPESGPANANPLL